MANEDLLGLLVWIVFSLWLVMGLLIWRLCVSLRELKYSKEKLRVMKSLERRIQDLTFRMRMK